jgi:glycosyltransferase involved in cell wall biosynthesis
VRRLRVAMVGQRGVPASFGGIEHHVEEIGARLADRGHDVVVYCRTNYTRDRLDSYRGMRLAHLPTVGTKHLDAIAHSAAASAAAVAAGVDIVHFHALGPGLMAPLPRYLSRAKVVLTVHGMDNQRAKWGPGASVVLGAGAWMSARVPDATVVVSRALAEHYRRRYRRATAYIPNGVDPAAGEASTAFIEGLGLRPREYLLFVGRLVPEKAPHLLVRAFRQVADSRPELRLVLVGGSSFTDDYVRELHRYAAGDPRILMPGYLFGRALTELYSGARAFVLPSVLEGMPLTLLEAASFGTPVVASAIGPHVEVLGHEGPGRRLFPPGDELALAAALSRCLQDDLAERAGAARLRDEVLARYRWDAAAEATELLYLSLLEGRRPALVQ